MCKGPIGDMCPLPLRRSTMSKGRRNRDILRGDPVCSEDHVCCILRLWLLSQAERKRGLVLRKVWVSSGESSAGYRSK